jgi:hypothetical protein
MLSSQRFVLLTNPDAALALMEWTGDLHAICRYKRRYRLWLRVERHRALAANESTRSPAQVFARSEAVQLWCSNR